MGNAASRFRGNSRFDLKGLGIKRTDPEIPDNRFEYLPAAYIECCTD